MAVLDMDDRLSNIKNDRHWLESMIIKQMTHYYPYCNLYIKLGGLFPLPKREKLIVEYCHWNQEYSPGWESIRYNF